MRQLAKKSPVLRHLFRTGKHWYRRLRGSQQFKRQLAANSGPRRIVLGASRQCIPGWISSEIDFLNLLKANDWERFFEVSSIDALLGEHVWEHLTPQDGLRAAKTCYRYLKPGGYLRVAVPDGLHPDPAYIDHVKIGGTGAGADDHKALYTYQTLKELFQEAGFYVRLYEYFDEEGHFHCEKWNPEDGMISRSAKFDERNCDGTLNYTSIIIDAIKDTDDRH
jgi:predicted SAM-dependent methyltransferase